MTYIRFGNIKEQDDNMMAKDFGSTVSIDGEERQEITRFSTGMTSTQALHVPVFGPFVKVVLKNLTADQTRRFKLSAYLSK